MDPRSILFFTNSELGQSNVHLAVAHELLLRPRYELHIASFPPLEEKVHKLNTRVLECASTLTGTATFHPLSGPSCIEAAAQHPGFIKVRDTKRGYGVRAAVNMYKTELPIILSLWNGADYLTVYESCIRVIEQVNPTLAVIDTLLSPAIDACTVSGTKFCLLGPNTFFEHIPTLRLTRPWKYPQ